MESPLLILFLFAACYVRKFIEKIKGLLQIKTYNITR